MNKGNNETCRDTVNKERLYDYLNVAIKQSEYKFIREEARFQTLKEVKENLDYYFEDLESEVE